MENAREKRDDEGSLVQEMVGQVRKEEVKSALKKIKIGKSVGPDNLLPGVWKYLHEIGVKYLASLFNKLLARRKMHVQWRKSTLIPIFKNNRDVQCGENYNGITPVSHTMQLWERIVENRLRAVVEISEQQYGFIPGRSMKMPSMHSDC